MATFTTRTLTACASIACASLLVSTASAELPLHPQVGGFGPTVADFGSGAEESPTEFGTAVAIRNGLAFSGMPAYRRDRGGVVVYTQTSTGWRRTAT